MDYRVLLILPLLQRRWAMCRLRFGLQPWIATWAEDTMFAGFQGWGAQDAHYETAIRLEHAKKSESRLVVVLLTFGKPSM